MVGHMHADRHPREEFPADKQGKKWTSYGEAVRAGQNGERDIKFWRGSAMAPLYGEFALVLWAKLKSLRSNAVLYSSGTTGKPKALIHSVGGMVLSSSALFPFSAAFTAHSRCRDVQHSAQLFCRKRLIPPVRALPLHFCAFR